MEGGFKKLIVWQKAIELVIAVYGLTEHFPKTEIYGLSSQMRRSAVSIPSNIAEGSKRRTKADFRSFLGIALGSTAELETQIEISKKLGFANADTFGRVETLLDEVARMLTVLTLKTHD